MASIYCIAALAVERYLEVVHPIQHRLYMTKGKIAVAMVLNFVLGPSYKTLIAYPGVVVVNGAYRSSTYSTVTVGRVVGAFNLLLECRWQSSSSATRRLPVVCTPRSNLAWVR